MKYITMLFSIIIVFTGEISYLYLSGEFFAILARFCLHCSDIGALFSY